MVARNKRVFRLFFILSARKKNSSCGPFFFYFHRKSFDVTMRKSSYFTLCDISVIIFSYFRQNRTEYCSIQILDKISTCHYEKLFEAKVKKNAKF